MKERRLALLALLIALAAFLVGAAPIALVATGHGMSLADLLADVPALAAAAQRKDLIFLGAGLLLLLSFWGMHRLRRRARLTAPVPPPGGPWRLARPGRALLGLAVLVYALGLVVAYAALPIAGQIGWLQPLP